VEKLNGRIMKAKFELT